MSRELFKMNMIASVQKLDNEDIEIIQNYIKTIEQENKQLKEIIYNAKDFCKRYLSLNLEAFDTYGLLGKLLEILGEKENE